MASGQTATFKLRIDTSQAKRDLADLTKQGEAEAGRVADAMDRRRQSAKGGFGKGFGLGAGVGFLTGQARSIAGGGLGDVLGEVFAGVKADIDSGLGGPEARAKRNARQEVIESMRNLAGREGITPEVRGLYQTYLEQQRIEQQGAAKLEQFLTGGTEGSVKEAKEVLDKLINAIVGAIKDGFADLIARALSFGGK